MNLTLSDLLWIIPLDLLIIVPIVLRIQKHKLLTPKKRKFYIVLTCIFPLIGAFLYSWESNRQIKERYSKKPVETTEI
ncbi:hypothetical protein D0T66_13530 [Dysgonomonas sp. 25]|nr:hypothetical protein [Dysgonomonas sp. 25]